MDGMGRNRIDTYDSIISLLLDNRDIVSTIRAFSYSTSKFCKVINVIKKQEQTLKSEQFRKAFRTSKCIDNLVMCLLPFSSALAFSCKKSGNVQLYTKYSKITQNYLFSLNEGELLTKAISIYIAAEKNLSDLKDYNINRKVLQDLKLRIDDFKGSMGYHKESEYFSDTTECSMEGLFLQADKILNNLDNYVENLDKSYSGFYNEYVSVRNTEHALGKKEIIKFTS